MHTVFTIGHSTRPVEEFIELLQQNKIRRLVDIRTMPRSRHNPQYEQTALEKTLPKHGIAYLYMPQLGGLRPKAKDSKNMGWHNESFRNYADYMQTDQFTKAIEELVALANENPTAIMCAEAVPWRCHRSLVGDALLVRRMKVCDIMSPKTVQPHKMTSFAVVEGRNITYPSDTPTKK
ncbi:MAG: hypothetical protein QG629_862 [Patescibacteria group bacterium]|nr:DUF488 domain-containing protein [Candidatus Saccharibacteria bacterium]MDQ5963779.1 hypothetical protein [Patescibacteria group bacterium]